MKVQNSSSSLEKPKYPPRKIPTPPWSPKDKTPPQSPSRSHPKNKTPTPPSSPNQPSPIQEKEPKPSMSNYNSFDSPKTRQKKVGWRAANPVEYIFQNQ